MKLVLPDVQFIDIMPAGEHLPVVYDPPSPVVIPQYEKLSDLMRKGAGYYDQSNGSYVKRVLIHKNGEYIGHKFQVCALTCIFIGAFGPSLINNEFYQSTIEGFPMTELGKRLEPIIGFNLKGHHVTDKIMARNDVFKWSVGAIADWLEGQGY